ncbi:hypothetical protein TNCV_3908851 [Trichonephila clavipes]|nr:hypothetical protein TNCV_3908851 [Trichonephila clavipes]
MDRLKSEKTSGMSITCPAATDKQATRFSADVTGLSYTKLLMWPQKKNLNNLSQENVVARELAHPVQSNAGRRQYPGDS